MENVAPCRGECRVDHDYQYFLRLAPVVVIRRVMSGDVGAGVPETSYLGAGRGGGGGRDRGYFGRILDGGNLELVISSKNCRTKILTSGTCGYRACRVGKI